MNRTRWVMTIVVGLAPMLGSMAMQRPASNGHYSVSAAGSSSSNGGGKSSGNSSTNSSGSNSTNSSANSTGSSSSSSSGVSVGVSPKAKVTNPHGPISTPCANCHTYTSWKPVRSNPDFNHDLTGYPLRGMHQKVGCTQCHASMVFKNVSSQCADCHADIHRRQFGASCSNCHSVAGWQISLKAIQNHQNRFPLVGAHSVVQCEGCHKQAAVGQFTGLATSCYSCHQKDFLTPVLDHKGLGLPTTCESCHTMDSWFNAKFDHLKYTGYALTGAHATLPCSACHLNNVFKGTSAQCYSCHAADFNNSNNPSHVKMGLPRDCSICHSTTDWSNAKFDHALYAHYPLTGKHAAVTCAQCHTNNNYNNTPTACYSCHQTDFQGTTNPPHVSGGFPTDCSLCHTTAGWTTSTFNHNATKFPLTGAHVTVACVACHVNGNYSGTLPTDCYGCHTTDYKNTNAPPHTASAFPPAACATCHTTTSWTGANFDHNKTAFPLTGSHITVPCAQCHTNNNFTTLPTDCYGCHTKDFTGTTNPNHVSAGFPTTCQTCHNTTSWLNSTFDHSKTTFPLTGSHITTPCASCHVGANAYSGNLPTDCYSCHTKDYNGTTNPNHKQTGMPTTCAVCHNTSSWTSASFDHNKTAFPLTGAHVSVACATCHVNNNYTTLPTNCYGCHQKDFTGTTNPNHVTAGFPTTCETCHNTTTWLNSTFDHSKTTFPLTGAHTTVACALCHTNNNYSGSLPTDCYSCHTKDYTGTTNPNHAQSGIPTTCAVCHNTTSWLNATFDHNKTTFPLTGAHITVACALCHVNNNYSGSLPTDCYSCHTKDYTGTTNPNHVSAGFPTTCQTCHTTASWTTSTFNHNTTTFPLTGAHTTVACALCHTNNNYSGSLPTDCYSCHTKDYTGTTNPAHVAAGFPTTCLTCHSTASWTTATFNHNTTPFPLTGFHATMQCAQCHTDSSKYVAGSLPTACVGCHQTDYNNTNNPPHATSGFPTTCDTCHTTTSWAGAVFDHSKTAFPLTGFHTTVACATCHVNNNYTTLPTTCVGCHQTDYNGTTNPNHATAGFPTTCETCHTTTSWAGATFNHNNTPFPLTGAHTTVACNLCHINNVFAGTPTDCYSCHTKDYTGTTNPNHTTAGWPTTCVTCHTTTAWLPATLPSSYHTFFPLNHGNANGVCATCHTNSGDYSVFTCTGCHGGNNAANFHHPNVNGYVYNSVNCLACHKNGGGG